MTEPETLTAAFDSETIGDAAIQDQLARIFASVGFAGSARLQQMLAYVVKETCEGRAERIKGVTVAQDVFGLNDPEMAQTSTIVSVEARRLRRKLSDYYLRAGAHDPIIVEIPKGAFVPTFRRTGDATAEINAHTEPRQKTISTIRTGTLPILAGAVALLVAVVVWVWPDPVPPPPPVFQAFSRPAIAVLPFRNATESSLNDPIVTGLTEDITTDLAGLREIDVISYSSVAALSDTDFSPVEFARTLHVSHILEGSIRGDAQNIRVSASLLDGVSGKVIWAKRFDRDLDDPLSMQNEIALQVVGGMSVQLSNLALGGMRRTSPTDSETSALFAQAMALANPPSDAARLKIAGLAFEAVIEADPSFAGGYAGRAYISAFKALWGHVPDPAAEAEQSMAMARKALDFDPGSALALDALALSRLVLRDFEGAIEASEMAVRVAPNDPYAHSYHAFVLVADGQAKAAVPFAERAVRLDPLGPRTPYRNILGVVHLHAGNYDQALQSFVESQKLDGPKTPGHIASMAVAYAGLGYTEEAAELAATLPPGFVEGPWLDWQKRSFRLVEDATRFPEILQNLR